MASPDMKKPASGLSAGPVSKIEQLGSGLNPSNTLSASTSQAPDISGEDDWSFFLARPGATTRIRLPFENEYPACVLLPGRPAFVRVWVERADRQLKRRRALRFCQGGHA